MPQYEFGIDYAKGLKTKCTPTPLPPSNPEARDLFLHALFARVALTNNGTLEFQTCFDPETNTIELIIPPEALAIFDEITGMQRGPKFQAYINWLIGSTTLPVPAGSSDTNIDPAWVSASDMSIWVGAVAGSLDDKRAVIILPAAELSAIGHNTKLSSTGSGKVKISLVWIYGGGSNNSFTIKTSANISIIGTGEVSNEDNEVTISTFNLVPGDIRETELLTTSTNAIADDLVSVILRRNFVGSPDPKTDLVSVLGIKIEFVS